MNCFLFSVIDVVTLFTKIRTSMFDVSIAKEHLRQVMIFFFNQKKEALKSHWILVETHDDLTITVKTFERWSQCFKSGIFKVIIKGDQLKILLDEDDTHTQQTITEQSNVTQ